jgi:hypothetical protein
LHCLICLEKVIYSSFTVTNDICRMSCWQPTTQVIVMWSALWYVVQWFNTLTYIDNECRKCLMHLVLLYIKKLMVCLFEFSQCAFVYNWIDLTHTMLLYCLIHFRFLIGCHTHTYIDSYCRKYLMHLVLLYINKLMVSLLNFAMCFCLQLNRPHSYNATLLLNPF